jgi:hypothetical protein
VSSDSVCEDTLVPGTNTRTSSAQVPGQSTKYFSQIPCLKQDGKVGIPKDMHDVSWQCSKYSILSPISLMNAFFDLMDGRIDDKEVFLASVDKQNHPLDTNKFGTVLSNAAHDMFPFRSTLTTYFTSQLMARTNVDHRPDCVKSGKCTSECLDIPSMPAKVVEANSRLRKVQEKRRLFDRAFGKNHLMKKYLPKKIAHLAKLHAEVKEMKAQGTELASEAADAAADVETTKRALMTSNTVCGQNDDVALKLRLNPVHAALFKADGDTEPSCANIPKSICESSNFYEDNECATLGRICNSQCSTLDADGTYCSTTTTTTTTTTVVGETFTASGPGVSGQKYSAGDDPAKPGNQDHAHCQTLTTKDACVDKGCQWWNDRTLVPGLITGGYDTSGHPADGNGRMPANGYVNADGNKYDFCTGCLDHSIEASYHSLAQTAQCSSTTADLATREATCTCAMGVGGCGAFNLVDLACPEVCGTVAGTTGCAVPPVVETTALSETCQCCEDYLSAGASTIGTAYQSEQCKNMVVIVRLRPPCETNHPDWQRISKGTNSAPTLAQQETYWEELISEYAANFKPNGKSGGKPVGKKVADGETNQMEVLTDAGVDVLMFHTKLLTDEILELITTEIGNLAGTFVMMIAFLYISILQEVKVTKQNITRIGLSMLVILQPILAQLFASGIGQLPIFNVPGDVDDDGEDDKVLPVTMLTMLGLHLLLAVVVDYDIIMVRAFDRCRNDLPFEKRMEEAMGYVHRTISISIVVGALAFLLGSIIDMPILVYFCLTSFFGLWGLYISLFTIFLGAFVICERGCCGSSKTESSSAEGDAVIPTVADTKLMTSNERDMKFAKNLTHPGCIGLVLVIELALLCIGFVALDPDNGLKASFAGSDYLLGKDSPLPSKTAQFIDTLNELNGGFIGTATVLLPSSDIAKYHKEDSREHFNKFFQNVAGDEMSFSVGVPSTFSWMEEFAMQHMGRSGDGQQVDPDFAKMVHGGCKPCPNQVEANTVGEVVIPQGGDVAQYLSGASKWKKLAPTIFVMTEYDASALQGGSQYMDSSTFDQEFEFVEAVTFDVATGHRLSDSVGLSRDASATAQSLRGFSDATALLAKLTELLATKSVTVKFRGRSQDRFRWVSDFSAKRKTCDVEPTFYEDRVKHWNNNPSDFYEYLHAWYEDWEGATCCVSMMVPNTLQDKSVMSEPHVNPYAMRNGKNIIWKWAEHPGGEPYVTGISESTLYVYLSWNLKSTEERVKSMKRLQKYVTDARAERPDLWGTEDDSYLMGSYFVDTDRDAHMMDYLLHHLGWVGLAVVLATMLFLHPIYGFAASVFILLINFQVMGIMMISGFNLDIVTFGVIVMLSGSRSSTSSISHMLSCIARVAAWNALETR